MNDDQMIGDLLDRLQRFEATSPQMRKGVVTSVAPLAVTVGGSTSYANVKSLGGPLAVGDPVSVVMYGGTLLVLGRISTPDPWHIVGAVGEPAFANSWVNYDTADPIRRASFYREGGTVRLGGVIKNGTVGSVPAFTLPAGYRPVDTGTSRGGTVIQPVIATTALGVVVVDTAGLVQIIAGANTYVDLSPISFRCVA